jgi:hypothetical protein
VKVLHLAIDEKFIPFARSMFAAAFPGNNRFRVQRYGTDSRRFVEAGADVTFVSRFYWFSRALERDLEWADCIVLHSLNRWFARALARAPARTLVVWHGWGGDYYDLLDGYSDRLHLPLTEALERDLRGRSEHDLTTASLMRRAARLIRDNLLLRHLPGKVLSRIDVVSMMPAEFDLLKRSRPEVRAQFHQLYYSSAEDSFLPGPPSMSGPNILLGNSATPTNNHLDAFEALRNTDLGDREIITPLSYGRKDYMEAVCARGRRLFGSRFVPVLNYMSADEFGKRIATCGFMVMNHVRQQATGTVSIGLLKGAKVFLREENLLLPFYREKGAHIAEFPPRDGERDPAEPFSSLSEAQRRDNRRVVMDYWSRRKIVAETRQLERFLCAP